MNITFEFKIKQAKFNFLKGAIGLANGDLHIYSYLKVKIKLQPLHAENKHTTCNFLFDCSYYMCSCVNDCTICVMIIMIYLVAFVYSLAYD